MSDDSFHIDPNLVRPLETTFVGAEEVWDLTGVIAGRTGISPDVLGTLTPIRPPAEKLCVPIDVQAFVSTGRNAETRADIATATKVPGASDAATIMPPPFTDTDALPAGVHLHWAMPDALCRADPEANDDPDDMVLPAVPDRWLVVRLGGIGRTGRRTMRSWIIESDQASGPIDLADWKDDSTPTAERLDVVVGGDVAWAAVYDNVVDRFGFHDDLDGAGRGPFSYVVVGWYSNDADDPIHRSNRKGPLTAILDDFGWALPADATSTKRSGREPGEFVLAAEAVRVPGFKREINRSVYHGAVFGVRTGTPRAADDPRPRPADVNLAIGTSGPTALAELLTDDEQQLDVLAAVGAAATDLLLDPDGGDALTARLHSLGFLSAPGGTVDEFIRKMVPPRRSTQRGLFDLGAIYDQAHPFAEVVAEAAGTDVPPTGLLEVRDRADHLKRVLGAAIADGADAEAVVDKPRAGGDVAAIADLEGYHVGTAAGHSFDVLVSEHDGIDIRDLMSSSGSSARPGGSTGGGLGISDEFVKVKRPLPRFYQPTDPVIQMRGTGRSRRHGEDGRFDDDDELLVRSSFQTVTGYRNIVNASSLVGSLGHGGVPTEADSLVAEAALLDPTTVTKVRPATTDRRFAQDAVADRLDAERALTDLIISGVTESWQLLDHSRRMGVTPSPVSIRRWAQPWVPMYVEWQASVALTEAIEASWELDEVDLTTTSTPPPTERIEQVVAEGREVVTAAAARTLGDSVRRFLVSENELDEEGRGVLSEQDERELGALAKSLAGADLVTVGLAGIEERIAGWSTNSTVVEVGADHVDPVPTEPPNLVRGGACRVSALRVVDAFGRILDLTGRLSSAEVSDELVGAPGTCAAAATGPGPAMHMRPRITALSRLMFRLRDATDDTAEAAIDDRRPSSHRNPIAGWLLPDHADDAVELFDAAGEPVGQLFHRGANREVTYEATPGQPGPSGARAPRGGDAPAGFGHLADFSDALLELDATARDAEAADASSTVSNESPLASLLRVIDTTLWTADPFGSVGLEHPSVLTGRPIAVVRADLHLDVPDDTDDYDLPDDVATDRRAAFERLAQRGFTVRLGSLGRMDDGLLGWFVDDDYTEFHPVHPAVAAQAPVSGPGQGFLSTIEAAARHGEQPTVAPITNPYVGGDHELILYPNQPRTLTMLMHPGLGAHLTSGFLPRKKIELARQWTEDALARILPSFRLGPVLVDPDVVRMPRISARTTTQSWARRTGPSTWRDDPIVAATTTAHLPDRPARIEEGWVRIRPDEEEA